MTSLVQQPAYHTPRALAAAHLRDVLAIAMQHGPAHTALLMFDTDSELSRLLRDAYADAMPEAQALLFQETEADNMLAAFAQLQPHDLVVLVQSQSFRLPNYRIRVELYKRQIKVIEHTNLARISGAEIAYYIDALAYDASYYRGVGHGLCALINSAARTRIESGAGDCLHIDGPLEPAKINIGDFAKLANVGSQFPIGEVFSEAQDLTQLRGTATLYAFTNTARRLELAAAPITVTIEAGRIVASSPANAEFEAVLEQIRADEGEVWVREVGFGMNRGFSREHSVSDVGAFERVCGIHLSLGAKHGVYKKPHLRYREARHHVDVFVQTEAVWLDAHQVYGSSGWQLPSSASAATASALPFVD